MQINLISDTVTKPSDGMINFMNNCKVGDDVFKEDPTVNKLEKKVSELFGMDHALFFPSGTMANQTAINILTSPGDQLICSKYAHVYNYEGGGVSLNSGVSCKLIDGNRGLYALDIEKDPLTSIERRSVDSMDALTALKMSSEVLTSDDLTHNIQWMAADVDNNGRIQAKDAWLVNNYVVEKSVANSKVGTWEFVGSNADFKNLGVSNTKLENDNLNNIAFTHQNRHFDITAFINGDVDGSFASNLT